MIHLIKNSEIAFKISKVHKDTTTRHSSPWYKGHHHLSVVEQYLRMTSDKFGASHEEFQGIGMDGV